MRTETKEFIRNWEIKLSEITEADGKLKELYEKFTTLYTIFNRYYNEAYYLLKQEAKLPKDKYADYERATAVTLLYLGAVKIIDKIHADNNDGELEAVIKLLEKPHYHINLVEGQPSEETDRELLKNLKSKEPEIKAKAILSLIYNVRCNIVHGYKDFQEHQRLLVEPLISLLQSVISLYRAKIG